MGCSECYEDFECQACWEVRVVRQRNEALTEVGNLRALLADMRANITDGYLASRIDAALSRGT